MTDIEVQSEILVYRRSLRRRSLVVAALCIALVCAFATDLVTGPSSLSAADVLRGLMWPDTLSAPMRVVVFDVRLPQALMAICVGASLALAGAEMQTILDNPLASPFTLGVSSAASFGAALAIVLHIGLPGVRTEWTVALNAFVFAFASVLLLQMLSRLRGNGGDALVLFGIAMVFTFNALVALIQFVASQDALQQLVFWSMGSLSRATPANLSVLCAVLCLVSILSFRVAWSMTALSLGEDRARSFGIHVGRLRFASLLRVSLLAAISVAFVGTIGFIGLVGPHIARRLVGEDHRFFLPTSMATGAVVLSLSSVLSKVIVPGAIMPVGIVTALIGVPFFVSLIFVRRERM
ncbi:iron ABC transporter permease [Rhizobium sp. YJ-22]|uniref:FecCD family ABC transporter permease n=1 Tax=Rhizobium sp. YJ-22 TaxID=3037556 RepID=UPI002412DC22|nr:iron ABC transporter permease [Rhizobium sp. YJ-22]MDG3578054.1 iron ABC transporter permease [Rhizobium sp. YJ-22]